MSEETPTVAPESMDVTEGDMAPGAVDVSPDKDGGVLKATMREGTGDERPCPGDKVSVHYVGKLTDGSVFDSSRDRGELFTFDLGKGSVIKAWDIGVATMKKDELAVFTCQAKYAYGEKGSPPKIPPNATLIFEVELFHWTGEDVSPKQDGSIQRSKLFSPDTYTTPNDGASVEIHLVGCYNGSVFEERDVSFCLGEGTEQGISEGLEHALRKFKKGEKSKLTVDAKHAYGEAGCPEKNIPPNATVEYEVTMKNFEKAKESWEMETKEKLEQSEIMKSKGSNYFKSGKFTVAVKFYQKVIDFLQFETSLEGDDKDKREALMLAVYLNLAMCKLKLGDNSKTIEHCDKALELNPKSDKGLFRRGQARFNMKDYEEAVKDFRAVLEVDPNNKAAKNQVVISNQMIKEAKEKEKRTYAGMFQKFAKVDAAWQEQESLRNPSVDGLNEIGEWHNDMAKGMMSIEQEMEAFGEKMPEPKYDKNIDYSRQSDDE